MKEESGSFLEKRTKKLLRLGLAWAGGPRQRQKSFLLLFFKKEGLAVCLLALTLFAPGVLNDGDTFTHIAAGQWMIAHGAVIHADPFSFSKPGAPWISHEWLAELLMAAAYRAAGWRGVVALTACAMGATFLLLGRYLARLVPERAVIALLVLAIPCFSGSLLARPHSLALPVFAAWVGGLFMARARGVAPSWWMLPLMVLWANLHGGFMVGLALVVPLAAEAVLADPRAWRRVALRWGGFLLAALAAAALTPHGVAGLLLPFRLTGMAQLAGIAEWAPTDFATLQPLEILLVVGLGAALTYGARLPPLRLAMLLGLLHMALLHARHVQLIGMIGPFLVAPALAAAPPRRAGTSWGATGACAAALIGARLALPIVLPDGPSAPVAAVAQAASSLREAPVFNDYAFGGYLMFKGIKPFIDGRAEFYGDDFLRRYAAARQDQSALASLLGAYRIAWTILPPTSPDIALLDRMPDWCRVYADPVAIIHRPCTHPRW
jgi:hypothetical protein